MVVEQLHCFLCSAEHSATEITFVRNNTHNSSLSTPTRLIHMDLRKIPNRHEDLFGPSDDEDVEE